MEIVHVITAITASPPEYVFIGFGHKLFGRMEFVHVITTITASPPEYFFVGFGH